MDGNLFHKAPPRGEFKGFFRGNMVAAVCLRLSDDAATLAKLVGTRSRTSLGHHLNI